MSNSPSTNTAVKFTPPSKQCRISSQRVLDHIKVESRRVRDAMGVFSEGTEGRHYMTGYLHALQHLEQFVSEAATS